MHGQQNIKKKYTTQLHRGVGMKNPIINIVMFFCLFTATEHKKNPRGSTFVKFRIWDFFLLKFVGILKFYIHVPSNSLFKGHIWATQRDILTMLLIKQQIYKSLSKIYK